MKAHTQNWKILNWWACSVCGLVGLKNDASRAAMRAPCPGIEPTQEERAFFSQLAVERSKAKASARKERGT